LMSVNLHKAKTWVEHEITMSPFLGVRES